jgi:hypothetical protein
VQLDLYTQIILSVLSVYQSANKSIYVEINILVACAISVCPCWRRHPLGIALLANHYTADT